MVNSYYNNRILQIITSSAPTKHAGIYTHHLVTGGQIVLNIVYDSQTKSITYTLCLLYMVIVIVLLNIIVAKLTTPGTTYNHIPTAYTSHCE